MSHELFRLMSKFVNTPHLVDVETLNRSFAYLEKRSAGDIEFAIQTPNSKKKCELQYNPDTQVGIIAVDGPLTYLQYDGLCGDSGCSYQSIQNQFEQMASMGAKTVVLSVDSPGGEAYSMFELGDTLRKLADKNNIKLITYVDGLAASAGYGIAACAHEVIANPMSELGSIGVVVRLQNINQAKEKMGISTTYIYAGKSKIPFDSEGEFTQKFLNDIQDKVDVLYEQFTNYVAKYRPMTVEAVKATEAGTFLADKAIALGLADKMMTREEFFDYLATTVGDSNMLGISRSLFMSSEDKAQMKEFDDLKAEMTSVMSQLEEKSTLLEAAQKALAEKSAEVEAVHADLSTALEKIAQFEAEEKAQAEAAEIAKKNARKEKLTAVVGADEAAKLFAVTETLNDESFATLLESFQTKAAAEKDSILFNELGHGSETTLSEVSEVEKLIREKYSK